MPLLRAEGVSKRYGQRVALAPLDLEVARGETVALVGPNGAGKSTLLSVLARALAPSTGRVEWAAGVRVGWAPQRPGLYGRLTARENLELFGRLQGTPVGSLLARFGLEDRPSSELSVGNRQRLNVAIALLGDPELLLLDEPTASLDPERRELLWEEVGGRALVFATQHAEEAARADRVVSLRDGALV